MENLTGLKTQVVERDKLICTIFGIITEIEDLYKSGRLSDSYRLLHDVDDVIMNYMHSFREV